MKTLLILSLLIICCIACNNDVQHNNQIVNEGPAKPNDLSDRFIFGHVKN